MWIIEPLRPNVSRDVRNIPDPDRIPAGKLRFLINDGAVHARGASPGECFPRCVRYSPNSPGEEYPSLANNFKYLSICE